MHQNGFTHRDLKPRNVFVVVKDPVWWVKIGDFGITKRILNEETFLKTEIGTRQYLAPEVIGYVEEDVSNYTNAVDIWSLGCICHRLLTHQLPFANLGALAPYCSGKSELPNEKRDKDEIGVETISFVKGLMAAQPAERWDVDSALQSLWLKDVVDKEMTLDTLARTTSRIMTRRSQSADHDSVRALVQDMRYTSIRPKENQRPRGEENLTGDEKAEVERRNTNNLMENSISSLRETERHTLNADSATRIQGTLLDHQGGKHIEVNEQQVRWKSEPLPSANFHGLREGKEPEGMATTIRKFIDQDEEDNPKSKEEFDTATMETEAKAKAKRERVKMKPKVWQEENNDPDWRLHMLEAEFQEMLCQAEGDIRQDKRQKVAEEIAKEESRKRSEEQALNLERESRIKHWQERNEYTRWRLRMKEAELAILRLKCAKQRKKRSETKITRLRNFLTKLKKIIRLLRWVRRRLSKKDDLISLSFRYAMIYLPYHRIHHHHVNRQKRSALDKA